MVLLKYAFLFLGTYLSKPSWCAASHTYVESTYYKEFSSQTKPKFGIGANLLALGDIKSVFTLAEVVFENFRHSLNKTLCRNSATKQH